MNQYSQQAFYQALPYIPNTQYHRLSYHVPVLLSLKVPRILYNVQYSSMCDLRCYILSWPCHYPHLTFTASLCRVEINSSQSVARNYCQCQFPSWKYKVQDYVLQIENSQIKGHTWRGIYTRIISMFSRLVTRTCLWWRGRWRWSPMNDFEMIIPGVSRSGQEWHVDVNNNVVRPELSWSWDVWIFW